MSASDPRKGQTEASSELRAGLRRLVREDPSGGGWHVGARLRNYFLTGLVIVGPVTITLYFAWYVHQRRRCLDEAVRPDAPTIPTLPAVSDSGRRPRCSRIVALTLIGALAANLLGRSLISAGEHDARPHADRAQRLPRAEADLRIRRQRHRARPGFQKVGLMEFPSKGIWSIVFVTGETTGEIGAMMPGGEEDLITVFMPTGIVAADGLRLLRAAAQRRVPRHERRGRGQDRSSRPAW